MADQSAEELPAGTMIGRLIERQDDALGSNQRRVVVGVEDGVLETTRAAQPSYCTHCGRPPKEMEVTAHEWDPDATDTWLDFECPCGETFRVGARAGSSDSYYSGAPEWESRLIERGWDDSDLGLIAPFYYVYDHGNGLDSYGLLAGPLPTFRTAATVAKRFDRLDASVSIRRGEEPEVAICHLCRKRMVPDRAGQYVDGGGNHVKYECGKCFKQEFAAVFDALSEITGTDVSL